jgi:NADPH-dependent 7-cyano-7-deazaguanine reductase QueF
MTSVIRTLSLDPSARISVQLVGRLTCRCPVNGERDEATVTITYTPVEMVLELAALADYLAGFQDRSITHEAVTAIIADEIRWSVMSDDVTVATDWTAVESIGCVITCSTSPRSRVS